MRILFAAMAVIGILASTANVGLSQSRPAVAPSLEGVWRGISSVTTGANASANPNRLPVMIIYTRGHYSVIAQDGDVPRPPRQAPPPVKTPGKPTDAEKIALYEFWAPVIAHSGTYEVKGNTLTQRNIANKGVVGVGAPFEFRLEDGGKTYIEIRRSAPGQPVSENRRVFTRLE